VTFSLDIRSHSDAVVDAVEADVKAAFAAIAAGKDVDGLNASCTPSTKSCSVEWRLDSLSPAVLFHPDCISCVRASCAAEFGSHGVENLTRDMTSGAGHDSVYTSKRIPTTMVFVPSRDGVSHNPVEYTEPEDCAIGAQVLMGAVLRYDLMRGG
jgi:acetylornithine deacetylase/succinyl-diaminopimelate desuccinylase-like protein